KLYLNKLLLLDSTSTTANFSKVLLYEGELDFEKKKEQLERLLLKDNIPILHLSAAGAHLGRMGYLDRGIEICKKAMELDPLYVYNFQNLAELYYLKEDYPKATAMLQKMYVPYPEMEEDYLDILSQYYSLHREFERAKELAVKIKIEKWKYRSLILAEYGLGNKNISNQLLNEYIEKYGEKDAYHIAGHYSFFRNSDKAFEWLNRSIEQLDGNYLNMLIVDPLFKNLHSDPRWIPLLKRLKFPEALKG
ncbi:MAG: tetratricopeptide repeat protein, partial [Saprospiraceae bacterium]